MKDTILRIPKIIENCTEKYKKLLSRSTISLDSMTIIKENMEISNHLYHVDSVEAMLDLRDEGYSGKIDLIYIDPPFFTMANYNNKVEVVFEGRKQSIEYIAYRDIWSSFDEYLEMITLNLLLMKELLSDMGTIYVHIDFRTVHYIKIIMDYIFGYENFLNEVIWSYKSGGTSYKYFSRKHDNILVYTKTKNYIFNPQKEKSYNRGFKPYRFKGVKEYKDTLGWYTLVNLKDVWNIDMVGRTSRERVGYGTQKPEALLERIILTSSNENSLVADFFSGSGTTLKVADRLKRRWIGSDKSNSSILTIRKRLSDSRNTYNIYDEENKPLIGEIKSNENLKKSILDIDLGKYILNVDSLNLSNKNKDLVKNILETDSLALIDYIGVGTKDNIFYEAYRTVDNPKLEHLAVEIPSEYNYGLLNIYIIDIFGNETRKILERMRD